MLVIDTTSHLGISDDVFVFFPNEKVGVANNFALDSVQHRNHAKCWLIDDVCPSRNRPSCNGEPFFLRDSAQVHHRAKALQVLLLVAATEFLEYFIERRWFRFFLALVPKN